MKIKATEWDVVDEINLPRDSDSSRLYERGNKMSGSINWTEFLGYIRPISF